VAAHAALAGQGGRGLRGGWRWRHLLGRRRDRGARCRLRRLLERRAGGRRWEGDRGSLCRGARGGRAGREGGEAGEKGQPAGARAVRPGLPAGSGEAAVLEVARAQGSPGSAVDGFPGPRFAAWCKPGAAQGISPGPAKWKSPRITGRNGFRGAAARLPRAPDTAAPCSPFAGSERCRRTAQRLRRLASPRGAIPIVKIVRTSSVTAPSGLPVATNPRGWQDALAVGGGKHPPNRGSGSLHPDLASLARPLQAARITRRYSWAGTRRSSAHGLRAASKGPILREFRARPRAGALVVQSLRRWRCRRPPR